MGNFTSNNQNGKATKSMSIVEIERLLIDGYLRRIHHEFDEYIIPKIFNDLVYKYWSPYKRIFCITPRNLIYITRIRQNNVNPKDILKTNNINPCISKGILARGICYASKIYLPRHVECNLRNSQRNKLYDVIFEVGGTDKASNVTTSNSCNAIVMNSMDNMNEQTSTIKLPNISQDIAGNGLVYSYHHKQLISVGGHSGNWHQTNCSPFIYGLSFNSFNKRNQGIKGWKWIKLCKMNKAKNFTSVSMVESKLIVAGGGPEKHVKNDVELYDFKNNELTILKQMKYNRCAAGLFYDKYGSVVYIGGGHNNIKAMKKMEYYDFRKDEWYNLASTEQAHTNYPLMWKYMGLLFIASCRANTMEYIDLRIGKKWNLMYYKYGIRLRKIFNISDEFWSSRLL